MSLIVAARFDTFDAAQGAADALMKAGVTPDALHTFFVNPAGAHDRYPMGGDRAADPDSEGGPTGAVGGAAAIGLLGAVIGGVVAFAFGTSLVTIVGGAGVGAYIGSLIGAMSALGRARPRRSLVQAAEAQANQGRASGVLLAVHTSAEHEMNIARLLKEAGGTEIERAHGRWREGKWEDFDPLASPTLEKNV